MAGALASDAPQLIGGLPWQARLAFMAIPYVVNSMFSGTQWVIVRDVVPSGSFILARSTMNLASGGTQVVGYALGGLALIWLSPRGLFLAAAVADVACLVNVWRGIASRPARRPAGGRGKNVVRRTAAVNLRLLASPVIRPLYLAQWIPGGLVVGCESLFVSYARTRPGGGGGLAGYLFAVTAAGMMAGDLLIGRLARPDLRDRLIGPLRLLLAAPYLVLLFGPPPAAVIVAGFAASAGYAASLPLTDRLIRHTGEQIRGQVMGLRGQGMMAGQSAGALAAGTAAGWLGPSAAMGVMAAASLAVTLALIPALRRSAGPRAEPAAAAPVPP